MKKRVISCLLLILVAFLPVLSHADVIGHIYKTDIKAYENYLQIPSYNCGGTTVIFARDLENYGYDVLWDSEAETVEIIKNTSKKITPMLPELLDDEVPVGTVLFDIYETNIKTYFEGKLIPSYNIGGKTAITFRSIKASGSLEFDSKNKTALLLSKDIKLKSEEIEHINYVYEIIDIMLSLDEDIAAAKEMALKKSFKKAVMEKLNLSSLALTEKMEEMTKYSEPSAFSQSTTELWWAMVNLDNATTIIKSSWNIFDDKQQSEFERYMSDSLAQRKNTLSLLAGEF